MRRDDLDAMDAFDRQQERLNLPPHSVEAEQSLIGGLLLDNEAWLRVAGVVTAKHFYRDDHRRIFRTIGRLCDAGQAADVVTVFEAMDRAGEAERVGGLTYLAEIANSTPSAANIRQYALIVLDRWRERELLAGLVSAQERAADRAVPVEERIEQVQQAVAVLSDSMTKGREPVTLREALSEVVDALDRAMSGEEPVGVALGLEAIDKRLGGLKPGNLVVVAGRPGMGKSALAMQAAYHCAEHHGAALVFSMEMTRLEVAQRETSRVSGVAVEKMRNGQLSDDDLSRVTAAATRMMDARMVIDDTPALSVREVRARAKQVQRKHGLALVVIDYLQLMRGHGDNRTQEVGSITRGLKALAKEMGVPVVALSQLSRKCEERNDKRPLMSDLRESGEIEQDSDVVLMIYRDEFYDEDSDIKGVAELIVAKNRMGAVGKVLTAFDGPTTSFRNLDYGSLPAKEPEARRGGKRSRGFRPGESHD